MKSIFDDLDQLIEQAVAKATNTEKSLQKKQVKSVKERGLEADKNEEVDEVEEAEDEEGKEDKPEDESADKITGDKEGGNKPKSGRKTGDDAPGTKTSKKLQDPPEKAVFSPKFSDISNKINTLRGSGSLRDEKVSSAVKSYLGTLSPAEKSALLTYLTNLAQIMTSVKSPDEVNDPSEQGIKIVFKKSAKEKAGSSEKQKGNEPANVVVVGGK